MNKSRKRVYILPNLITTASLSCGLLAVVRAVHGDFQTAMILILVCAALDMMDGHIARMSNSVSQFGSEYDSLSDAIAFGVAPALIIYLWFFQTTAAYGGSPVWDKAGIPVCIFYSITTVLRLVRFNIQSGLMEKHVFRGLPSPAAAVFLISCLWLMVDGGFHPNYALLMPLLLVAIGILMVSTISFYSLKTLGLRRQVPFLTLLVIVASGGIIAFDFLLSLFIISFSYVLSGPALLAIRLLRRQSEQSARKSGKQTSKA